MRSWAADWSRSLGEFFFPIAQCAACGRHSLDILCPPCLSARPKEAPSCPRCAELLDADGCPVCAVEEMPLDATWALGRHDGSWARVARRFKYDAPWLAPLLADLAAKRLEGEDFTMVEAVPMWPSRRMERGYNPPALLAGELAKRRGWPFRGRLLRTRPTQPQVGLSRKERMANLSGAFTCAAGPELEGAHVLLVDDVMTTGSTIRACANTLRRKGVASIAVLVVARD